MQEKYYEADWIVDFEAWLRGQFDRMVAALRLRHEGWTLGIGGGPWGGATGANGYSIWITGSLPDVPSERPDSIALCVSIRTIDTDPEMEMYTSWDHPSGYLEGTAWKGEHIPFHSVDREEIQHEAEKLTETMSRAMRRGVPHNQA